jgi:hypothetical protein
MTNIKLKRGKEIDLLAMNPRTGEKFHVESRVATSPSFKLRLKDTQRSNGTSHRRGVDYFEKQKFNHQIVADAVRKIFGDEDYRKIIVVWDVKNDSVVKQAKEEFDIEIWFMDALISELEKMFHSGLIRGSRDDILRTVELITKKYKVAGKRPIFQSYIDYKELKERINKKKKKESRGNDQNS